MGSILEKLSQLLALCLLASGCLAQNAGDVRLVGKESFSGRLEVFLNGTWGTVCDDAWHKTGEDVVCRQLGYVPRLESNWSIAVGFEPGSGGIASIVMDEVVCTGSELRLTSCSYLPVHDCEHHEDVGVTCRTSEQDKDKPVGCTTKVTFETGFMGYTNSPKNAVNWTLNRGPTPSDLTGPSRGRIHKQGQYVYMEASYPAKPNDEALLLSPMYPAPYHRCKYTFHYSMAGATVGQLALSVLYSDGTSLELWSTSSELKGTTMWQHIKLPLQNRQTGFQLQFRATRGVDYTGDIALDDIDFWPGCCRPNIECHQLTATYPLKITFDENVQVARHSCPHGYRVEGNEYRFCSDSCRDGSCVTSNLTTSWSGAQPTCFPVSCPVPIPPRYGRVAFLHGEEGLYQVNTTLAFHCVHGFTLHGSTNRTCIAPGIWSGQEASCEPTACPQLDTPVNGWSTPRRNGAEEISGCDDGYFGHSRLVRRTCLRDGSWDGAELECAVLNCGPINAQWPMISESTGTTLGSIAHHSCPLGFVMSRGNDTQLCRGTCSYDYADGRLRPMCSNDLVQWTGETPYCSAGPCASVFPPANGSILSYSLDSETQTKTIIGFRGVYGMKVRFACDLGYELLNVSMSERQCVHHRRWTGSTPECVDGPCESVFAPDNGRVVSYELKNVTYNTTTLGFRGIYGMKVDFACNAGYRLEQAVMRQRECAHRGRGWSGDDPKCIDVCAGASCPGDSKCQIDPYSPNSHVCVCKDDIDCPSVPDLVCASNARTYQHPCLAAVEACHQNTSISIVATGRCMPASVCQEPQPRAQLSSTCPGARSRFFFNSTSSSCDPMLWSDCFWGSNVFDTVGECQDRCNDADPCELRNDTGVCSDFENRYFYQPDAEQCASFAYGGCYGNENNFFSLDDCEECHKRCPVLHNPANGEVHGRRRFVGSIARFTCARGYTISGSADRVCDPSLQWTGEPVVCQQDCVHPLCSFAADYTCPIGKNTIETSCGNSKELGLIDFAFTAFHDPSASQCNDKGTYSIKLIALIESVRTQKCSFLPDSVTDVIAEADFRFGCPCPLPNTSGIYLVTGLCDHADQTLKLTTHSVFVPYSDVVQNETETFCGMASSGAVAAVPSFG